GRVHSADCALLAAGVPHEFFSDVAEGAQLVEIGILAAHVVNGYKAVLRMRSIERFRQLNGVEDLVYEIEVAGRQIRLVRGADGKCRRLREHGKVLLRFWLRRQ